MHKMPEALRAQLATALPVPLSQGDIFDDCPLVFWADHTRLVADDDKPHSVSARVIVLTRAVTWRTKRPSGSL